MAIFGGNKHKEEKKAAHAKRAPGKARQAKLAHGKEHDIILAPWFSEKALLSTDRGIYVFAVPPEATKAEIAGAIQALYKVAPKKVRIVNLPGKRKMLRSRRGYGTRARRSKAYVYLAAGESIQLA